MISITAVVQFKNRRLEFDLSNGLDISIPFEPGGSGPNCFFAPPFEAEPLVAGEFVGSVDKGAPVNFYNVRLNPHGNGTHTETVRHISNVDAFISDVCPSGLLLAQLLTIEPQRLSTGDLVIGADQIRTLMGGVQCLIVRTMPNNASKKSKNYSGTNPPYFEAEAIKHMVNMGVQHLIVDLPSIDREEDGGRLSGHRAFWNYPVEQNKERTITEMVYIDDAIKDGLYLVGIHAVAFVLDAAPSRVVLYPLTKEGD